MGLLRRFLLACSRNERLARRLPRLGPVRRAVRRFMPGEELEDALAAAERLDDSGATSLLTLLGENVADRNEAREVAESYTEMLRNVEARKLPAEISVKPTHLGLDLGEAVALRGLRTLAGEAAALGNFVWIDMEGSPYLDPTLGLYHTLREEHDNVGVCLQAYLYRTPDDLEALLPLEPAIRLVKGAYLEPAEIAHPDKKDVDRAYLTLAGRLLDAVAGGRARAAFGTHDSRLIEAIRREAPARGVAPDGFEVQMLYGVGREEQRRLLREGTPLRILISYGPAWFPWYMRRLAERPANLWFVLRSAFRR